MLPLKPLPLKGLISTAGKEADDSRLLTEAEDASLSVTVNNPGAYRTVCVEIELDALAVNTLLQSAHVNDVEGAAGAVAFDTMPQASLEEMLGGQGKEDGDSSRRHWRVSVLKVVVK